MKPKAKDKKMFDDSPLSKDVYKALFSEDLEDDDIEDRKADLFQAGYIIILFAWFILVLW